MQHVSGAWLPYLVGTLIGMLSMATFYFSNKPLSASTAYARLAGLVGNLFSKGPTENLKFYQDTKPKIECGVMLAVGMLLGAFIAAFTGGEITAAWLPALWEQRFGTDVASRLGVAFVGGLILAYGARHPAGGGLHQRPRHQRRTPTVGEFVDCARVLVCCSRRNCPSAVSPVRTQ